VNYKITNPSGYDSDHFVLVATMQAPTYTEHKAYLREQIQVPLPTRHDFGPMEEVNRMLTDLQQHFIWMIATLRKLDTTWRLMRSGAALGRFSNPEGDLKTKSVLA
jgi:hypothetical protein